MQLQFFLLQGGELFPAGLLPFFPVEKPLEAQGSFRDAIRQGQQTLMRLVRGEGCSSFRRPGKAFRRSACPAGF